MQQAKWLYLESMQQWQWQQAVIGVESSHMQHKGASDNNHHGK